MRDKVIGLSVLVLLAAVAATCTLDFDGFGPIPASTTTSTAAGGAGGTGSTSSGAGGQGATGGSTSGGSGGSGGTGAHGGAGGGQAGGPPCTPIGLVEAFDGNAVDQNTWNMQGQTNMLVVSNGTLKLDASQPGVSGGWAGLVTPQSFAFQGHCVWIEALNLHHNGNEGETYWQLHSGGDTASFSVFGGNLELHIATGGAPVETTLPYNATDHRWWRIREAGGTLYMETAPQGKAWTVRLSAPSPTYLGDVVVGLGVTDADAQPIVGFTELDHLNVPAP